MKEQDKIELLSVLKQRFKDRAIYNVDLLFDYLAEKLIDKELEIPSTASEEESPF